MRNNKKIAASSRKLYSSVLSISVLELWLLAMLAGNKNTKLDAMSATMKDGVRNFSLN
jgi:hypothetical protein